MLPEYSLKEKRVVVTGAGRGIGKGIALVLAEAGAYVAVTGLTPTGVDKVAETINGNGGHCLPFVADATKQEAMDRVATEAVHRLGGLDAVVNCVGDGVAQAVVPLPGGEAIGMTQQDWQRIVDLNLTEAFLGCRAFGPVLLQQRRGGVINVSSVGAFRPRALGTAYTAAKAGVEQFTRSLALEWAPYGVRVNAIAPGQFPDPEQLSQEDLAKRQEQVARRVPLGRAGRLREVGLLAVYLVSEASCYVTGQCFAIDGGLSLT
ncbi:MAG: SDR family NAD(P)-dependent oxidoreductase [Chloroflexota bacterium]|nr:SDR family NAD(P)-dependent oxidoreductase [Chloroflexota bacterium]